MVVEPRYTIARYHVPTVVRNANCCPSEAFVHVDEADLSVDVYKTFPPRVLIA